MKRTAIYFITISLLLIVMAGCYYKTSNSNTPLSVIKFDNQKYHKTDPEKIIVYTTRKDIPEKYIEIGTIKFERIKSVDEVKELAAENGAEAIILEGNNYVLIIFKEINKEENLNENKKT